MSGPQTSGLVGSCNDTFRPASTHYERNDAVDDELVDEVRVEFYSLGIDGVVAAAQWDDSWPGDGKPVRLHAILTQQRDIVFPTFVRVGGNVPIFSIESHPGRPTKVVPD